MFGNEMEYGTLVEKWSDPALDKLSVADITDPMIQYATARVMQNIVNEAKQMAALKGSLLFEAPSSVAPTSVADGQWNPVALALARRVTPDLFAWKCVSVQPMSGPVGLAYATRFVYKSPNTGHEVDFDNMDLWSGYSGSISGVSGTSDTGTGVSTATAEAWAIGSTMPEIIFKMVSTSLTAKSRKLSANISLETILDVRAMHNVDVKKDMVAKLHNQVVAEIDRELLFAMKTAAVNTADYGEAATTWQTSASDGSWQGQKYSTVANAIIQKANTLGDTTRVAPANFVVVSTRVASILQAVPVIYTAHNLSVGRIGSTALASVGTLNQTIEVYVDRYARNDYALVGLNGANDNEYGLVYSPYVMGLESEATGQDEFGSRIGVLYRYAITASLLGSGRYYRQINFQNLTNITQ